jgi:hypothetical protein
VPPSGQIIVGGSGPGPHSLAVQAGGGLHSHVAQPLESVLYPYAQTFSGHAIAGQMPVQRGALQLHVPSVLRPQVGGTTMPPSQIGCANGGGGGHSFVSHAGGGLQAQVGQPFASMTLPHWQ